MALERLIGVLSVMVKANTAAYEAGMSKSARETANAAREVKKAERDFFAMTRQVQNAGRALQDVGRTLTVGVTLPLAAAGGMAVKTAIAWESAFAGVRKTVDGSREQLQGLEKDLLSLATRVPASTGEIASVAEMGGQLGVARDKLIGFTETIVALKTSTDLTFDAAATGLARIALNTKTPQSEFSNLGSTIVALGNAGASTESEIVSMGLRVSAAGSNAGMTAAQVLGVSAALSNVGMEAEAGGSAVSKIITDIGKAVATGGQELTNYAKVAGKTATEFKAIWEKDASEGLTQFLEGLGRLQGPEALRVLQALGIEEIRTADAAKRLAQSGDNLRSSIALATDAYGKNTAMFKEAEQRYATTQSKLEMLKNRFELVALSVGNALLPGINSAIALFDRLMPVAQRVADGFGKLPGPIQLGVVGFLGLAAAVGPVVWAAGSLITSVGGALRVMQEFGVQAQLMAARAAIAAAATRALGVAAAVTGPGMATLNAIATWLGNTWLVTTAREIAATAATYAHAAAQRALAVAMGMGQASMSFLAARLGAIPGLSSAAAAASTLLSTSLGGLATAASTAGVAALAAGVGFASWKFGQWYGESSGLTDTLGILTARLVGGTEAAQAYARHLKDGRWQEVEVGKAAEEAAARVKELQDQLSGQGTKQGAADLEAAVRKMAESGQLTGDALARVAAEAERLKQAGGQLSPYMQTVLDAAARSKKQLEDLASWKRGAGGERGGGLDLTKPSMSAEQQAKALVQVQGELTKLQAAHRGTYAAGIADIQASIATRLKEAAGVAALTGSLLTLQAAQVQAFNQRFVQEQLGTGLTGYQQQVGDIAKAVELAGKMGQALSFEQIQVAGQKLAELQAKGAAIPPELEKVLEGFRAFEDAARAVETVNALFADQQRILGLLGPSVKEITNGFLELSASADARGGMEALSEEALSQYVDGLRKLQQAARASGVEVPGLADALGEAWRRLQDLQAGPTVVHNIGEATAAAKVETVAWSERVRDLAAAFQVLGIDGKSGLGQLLGGITTSFAAFQKLGDMRKWTGKSTIGNFFSGGAGNIVGNITNALGAASAAISVGKAIFGLFHKSPVEKAAEQAGKYLGQKVSDKLAQAILDDAKKLGVSIQAATLLHLTEALDEAGRSVGSASAQVGDLFAGIARGSIPAARGVEELGKLFSKAGDEAASIGKAYNASTVAMIQAARQTGITFPGMAEAVAAGLDKVIAGFEKLTLNLDGGKYLGGLDPRVGVDPDQVEAFGRAQGALFVDSFWVVVGERGMVAGADAFRKTFGQLRDSFKDLFPPELLDGLLGPVERIMALTEPGGEGGPAALFRGAAESASALKDIIDGLAQSGYLTGESLANSGLMAQNAYQQALAGGATEKEALLAIKPLLQANLDAAAAYGLQLDDNTQKLVDQSEAAGMTFKVDPMMQMVDLLKVIAQALGAELPASVTTTTASFKQLGDAGERAVGDVSRSFGDLGEKIVLSGTEASTSYADALEQGLARAVSATDSAMGQMTMSTENAWARADSVAQAALGAMAERIDGLARGVVVPIQWRADGFELPVPELPHQPEIPRAAKGLYTKASPGGSLVVSGEAGRDEITAPVDAVLQRAFDAARGGPSGALDLGPLVAVLQRENAALRAEVGRLADRPIEARLHADGRAIADLTVEQLAAGNSRLEGAVQRAAAGQRKG